MCAFSSAANSQGDSSDEDSVEDVEYEPNDDWKKVCFIHP